MHQIYFDKDEGGGGPTDPAEGLRALLAKKDNDATAVAGMLYQENYQHRERIRQLTTDLEATKGKVPAEGHVVLPQADAQALEAYRKLGTADDLGKLNADLAAMRRDALLQDAAGAHGYKVAVLKRLAGDGLALEMRDVAREGKTARRAFVVEDGGKATDLEDYAKAQWPDFLSSLPVDAQGTTRTAVTPGAPLSPKPAAPAGTGAGQEDARKSVLRNIRNQF